MRCRIEHSNGSSTVDIVAPYSTGDEDTRLYDTMLTVFYDGINTKQINPFLYDDMIYLRNELNKIRTQFGLKDYHWSDWKNDPKSVDSYGHMLGVNKGQPIRAKHFNEVRQCCLNTYEELLRLSPPVSLNVSPSVFRSSTGLVPLNDSAAAEGYVLQHYVDKNGKLMNVDEYFPEWRKIIDLLNRN